MDENFEVLEEVTQVVGERAQRPVHTCLALNLRSYPTFNPDQQKVKGTNYPIL